MTIMGTDSVSCGSSEISFIMVKSIIKALLSLSTTTALSWPSLVANTSKLFVRSLFTRFFHPCKSLSLFHPPSPPPPISSAFTLYSDFHPIQRFHPPPFFFLSFSLFFLHNAVANRSLTTERFYKTMWGGGGGGNQLLPAPNHQKDKQLVIAMNKSTLMLANKVNYSVGGSDIVVRETGHVVRETCHIVGETVALEVGQLYCWGNVIQVITFHRQSSMVH